MKRRRVVELTALSGLTLPLAGCANEATEGSDDVNNDTSDGNESGEDEEDAPTNAPTEQEFSGTGDRVIDEISLEGGLTIVDATYDGEGDFQVRLIPDDGAGLLFADESGAYDGQTASHIDDGTYHISVVASGSWEVLVQQPRATSGENPPLSISGTGNEVHGPFQFDGSHEPSGDHEGDSISVNILSSTDDTRTFVFHEGSIHNPAAFDFEGVGYTEIKADGEWSLEIE